MESANGSLILPLALLINNTAECYDMKEVMFKLGLPVSKLLKEVEAEARNDRLYLPLLFLVQNTLANVKIKQESPAALQLALGNFIGEYGRLNPDTAARYYNIGLILYEQDNYDAASTCHCQALDIRLMLYGLNHADSSQIPPRAITRLDVPNLGKEITSQHCNRSRKHLISEKIFRGKSTQTFPSLVIGLN
jgi:tetratricopeptide (TPR) repeat protein